MSVEALLFLSLTALPLYLVGVRAALEAWPLVAGCSLAVLMFSTGVARRAARRLVDRENREAAAMVSRLQDEIDKERAEVNARCRAADYAEQINRRALKAFDRERKELDQERQRIERKAGELVGARQHIRRLTKKNHKPLEEQPE